MLLFHTICNNDQTQNQRDQLGIHSFSGEQRLGPSELDLEMVLTEGQDSIYPGNITMTVFENESEEPTWIKEITVK